MDISKFRVKSIGQLHSRNSVPQQPTATKDGNGVNRMPEAVSKHVIEYFLKNADVMLFDTNNRTAAANSRRSIAFKNLVAELKRFYGYDANEKKIRNHWDYMKSKAICKGMASRKAFSREKSYRSQTGGGRCFYQERSFEHADNYPFDDQSEEAIWRFYDGTPAVESFREGESNVGRRNSSHVTESSSYREPQDTVETSRVEERQEGDEIDVLSGQEDANPNLDEFMSDSGDGTDNSQYVPFRPPKRRRKMRVTEADLLEEQYLLCQEQRQFFATLQHTMMEMCSFIQHANEQFNRPSSRSQEDRDTGNQEPAYLGDQNIEQSAGSISTD
ncbi:hypothetical protein ANCCAN_05926 [Ancylostoma caninum]|uniref:Uncharacterized protein n=1 Tax=Ancylostoma caninum TaxID=29170 RepID=A0A368GYC9_ANCCA|nr:hypothetical protein ANCCAN_05926 [Ancylostoma caninum]